MEYADLRGRTILIADDEEYVRHHLSRRLETLGLRVLQARTGEDVLNQVNDGLHLIVMDVRMPVMDGLETLRRLREKESTAAVPVVLLSAMARQGEIQMGKAADADEYIMKPITFDRLLESIRRHLR